MKTGAQNGKLGGKAALVTGGSRCIGAAIARRLAAEGAAVALTYCASPQKADDVVQGIESAGGKALAIRADASDFRETRIAVQKTVEHFGFLDILVNNAGVNAHAPIEEFPVEEFERLVAVNVKGVFYATREAARVMRDDGRIINIGSCTSSYIPFAGGSVYALTKGALSGFTKGLARDLGSRRITVNNVQPGAVDTDMNPADSDFGRESCGYIALQRYAKCEEIAAFVSFLAGPEASYITGASLLIDGGYAA